MLKIQSCIDVLYSAKETVQDCHERTKQMCSEVVVWMVSDFYRIYKTEQVHALPVAYVLKGFSLTSEIFRKMHLDMLQMLHENSIYTPVSAADGQWAQLSVKDSNGYPLTMLQLQKEVSQEARKIQKSVLQGRVENILKEAPGGTTLFEGVDKGIKSTMDSGKLLFHIGPLNNETLPFWSHRLVQRIIHFSQIKEKSSKTSIQERHIDDTDAETTGNRDYIWSSLNSTTEIDAEIGEAINIVNLYVSKENVSIKTDTLPAWFEHGNHDIGDCIDNLFEESPIVLSEQVNGIIQDGISIIDVFF